uniref:Uncharacterized protein n=1 Tax=Oryza brachyantha TaxID=4533 RepID=J3MVQ2_ORYBR
MDLYIYDICIEQSHKQHSNHTKHATKISKQQARSTEYSKKNQQTGRKVITGGLPPAAANNKRQEWGEEEEPAASYPQTVDGPARLRIYGGVPVRRRLREDGAQTGEAPLAVGRRRTVLEENLGFMQIPEEKNKACG